MNGEPKLTDAEFIHKADGPSKFRKNNDYIETFGEACGMMLQGIMQGVGHHRIFRSCATCRHWVEFNGCGKFQRLPPVEVIVTGCNDYDDNLEIPF
jgi:hypothetical protein